MKTIYACKRSIERQIAFALISVSILPLLLIKWSNRIKRFFLYSYTNIEEATHLFIKDDSKI